MAKVKTHFHDELEFRRSVEDANIGDLAEAAGLHFDSWTGSYRDQYNDLWVSRPTTRKLWTVATREAYNLTLVHSRHRELRHAIASAKAVLDARRVKMGFAA